MHPARLAGSHVGTSGGGGVLQWEVRAGAAWSMIPVPAGTVLLGASGIGYYQWPGRDG